MPHINDLSQNVIWEGNNGERWIVDTNISSSKGIDVRLKRLEITEELIPEE